MYQLLPRDQFRVSNFSEIE